MIINSLLDNDFYKFTMMHAVREKYPDAQVRYEFINRDPAFTFTEDFLERIQVRIQELKNLRLTEEEYAWLQTLDILPKTFLDFLKDFRCNPDYIHCELDKEKQLKLLIEGPWHETILFEVPVLAIISQTYFETIDTNWDHSLEHYAQRTREKGIALSKAGCVFTDFGTRRRRSFDLQETVIDAFESLEASDECESTYRGTSNVHFSRLTGRMPIGTMAHEWIMAHAGMFGIDGANVHSMQAWYDVFKGKIAIGLTDTYTTDLFFKEFSPELAKAYSGVRQDSGDPLEFTDKAVAFYKNLGINPKTKKAVYSDSLDLEKAVKIQKYAENKIIPLYGIGTFFTNDFEAGKALNIVIKLFAINNTPVFKITDHHFKESGDNLAKKTTIDTVKKLLKPNL